MAFKAAKISNQMFQKDFLIVFYFSFQEFVEIDQWAHLDIAGVMDNKGDILYMGDGMSGKCVSVIKMTIVFQPLKSNVDYFTTDNTLEKYIRARCTETSGF